MQSKFKSQSQIFMWLSFFCRNNGWLMENMDKGLTVPKWVLVNCQKIPQCPKLYLPNLSAQAQKFGISMKKKASLGVRSQCGQATLNEWVSHRQVMQLQKPARMLMLTTLGYFAILNCFRLKLATFIGSAFWCISQGNPSFEIEFRLYRYSLGYSKVIEFFQILFNY